MRRVLVIGASARAAAASAHRAGYRVHALDLFADRDLQSIAAAGRIESGYPHRAAELADQLPGMPWLFTGGLENYPQLIEHISRKRPLLGMSPTRIRQVRNPDLLAQAVGPTSFQFPCTRREQPAAGDGTVKWLRKPARSCGGTDVQRAGDGLDMASLRAGSWLWQAQVSGAAHSAAFVADGHQCRLLGVTRQWVAGDLSPPTPKAVASPFAYVGSVGPLAKVAHRQLWEELGEALTRRFGLTGVFGVDAMIPADESQRPYVLEVNPRYTASMELMEMALGRSVVGMHINACEGNLTDVAIVATHKQFGKAYCFATRRVRVTDDFLRAIDKFELIGQHPTVADIPQLGSVIEPCQPVLTVFATASDADAVQRKLGLTAAGGLLQRISLLLEDQPSGISGVVGS